MVELKLKVGLCQIKPCASLNFLSLLHMKLFPSIFPLQGVGSDENETGLPLNPDDIQLVMTRTCCSQSKAIECLEGSNGNVVMAITLIEMVCNNTFRLTILKTKLQ